ncbi:MULTISPECIES: hypothetical protein, partial [unclassified Cryobacterium]
YGLFMTPLGWGWAAFVWGYAIAWALVNDRIKLLAYRILDPAGKNRRTGRSLTNSAAPSSAAPEPHGAAVDSHPEGAAAPETEGLS